MVENRPIKPGAKLYSPHGNHEAKVRAAVQNAAACNGWTYWRYEAKMGCKPINFLRDKIRKEMPG